MDNGTELIDALKQISKEKGIDEEIIFEAIETSLVSACKKNFGTSQNVKVVIDRESGNVAVYAQKEVVETVKDSNLEISMEAAKRININYDVGDVVDIIITPRNFGRISAQTAKQVVVQKFREAEREILYNEYITKEKDIVTGIVQRRDRRNVIVALGKIDAVLAPSEQMPNEEYNFQDRLKVYVTEVKQTTKGPVVNVSRTHPDLVKRLFEQEVPEVYDGTVEIKSISREAGYRTKIAVYSKNPNVEAVGACVGQNGSRVSVIISELGGEKIDIINWSNDPKKYIAAALSPSKVLTVIAPIGGEGQSAKIVVPDNQLSLAIGKEGQNARLAAKLTGWRIDIKSESQAKAIGFLNEEHTDEPVKKKAKAEKEHESSFDDDLDNKSYDGHDAFDKYDDLEDSYDNDDYDDDDLDDNYDDYDDDDYDDDDYDDDDYDDDYDDDDYDDDDYDDDDYDDYDDDDYDDDYDDSEDEFNNEGGGTTPIGSDHND